MKTKTGLNTLKRLLAAGQSPWYDNIDRRLLKSGELKRLFETGLVGVTSNPTIFEKAVSGSDEYDGEIKRLSGEGKSALEIYDMLTIADIERAADLLKNTYEESAHTDGYVSIEVLPEYAHDAETTVKSAQDIFRRINRPNIMIKIPGTKEAPEAIHRLTKDGINVNVTLLFSVKHYENCARAYMEGLKARLAEGNEIKNIRSVASVFVSRVDTKIDNMLGEKEELKGAAAVANCKIIYQKFKELFKGSGFERLAPEGGNIQRVLWASTSTKNPAYSDLKYVEELIGPDTVNTMPPRTVRAFLDHGEVASTVEKDLKQTKDVLTRIKALGMDMDNVCQEIQDAGVKAFQDSFNKLIESIKTKMQ